MYVRPKYKLITPPPLNLKSYAHRFGFPEVNKEYVYEGA